MSRTIKRIIIAAVAALAVIIVGANTVTTVPEGYVGVKYCFGTIVEDDLGAGLHIKVPFVESIKKIDTREKIYEVNTTAYTQDTQTVEGLQVKLNYRYDQSQLSNLIRSISGFLWVFVSAFASTCSSLVSNLIGEGHTDSVPRLIRRVIKLAYIPVTALALIFALFPKTVIGIYTDMPDLISASVRSLWVLCFSYLFTAPALICFNAISGTGNTRTAFALEMAALVIYVAFCLAVIAGIRPDVSVCWLAELVYAISMLTICGLYLRSNRWKGTRI